jgi:hypothetical protein
VGGCCAAEKAGTARRARAHRNSFLMVIILTRPTKGTAGNREQTRENGVG